MRILLLSQYFAPEPAAKFTDLARALGAGGHEVQILTGFPCYPLGQTYEGYRQTFFSTETIDGNLVTRVAQYPDHSKSVFKRACYYISFAISAATVGLARTKRADVMLVYQSAMPTGLAAWVISRVKRMPYVLDVVDLWPESVAASGMLKNRLVLWLINVFVKFIYDGAAQINVITNGYRKHLIDMGVNPGKIRVIHHWPQCDYDSKFQQDEIWTLREKFLGRFNIFYAGQVGPCQHLKTVLEAAAQLIDLPTVQFVIAGNGVEYADLKRQAALMRLDNVLFLGHRCPDVIMKMYALSEMLLIHLRPDPMSRISIPSKTFSCMAAGRPLLMSVEGEASEMVRMHQCGVVVPPSDPKAMADAVREFQSKSPEFRQAQGNAARKSYLNHYNARVLIPEVENSLLNAVEIEQSRRACTHENTRKKSSFYSRYGKRLLDLSITIPLLITVAPWMAIVAVLVRIKLGSPVLFSQRRPGLYARLFIIRKFRSMTDARDDSGELLQDEKRLQGFGRWLRETSFDELPQLISVLFGDMSLVGPRPLLEEYLDHYTPEQMRRHDVRPGITGLAQVRGRNAVNWEEKFNSDLLYVDSLSFLLDMQIIFQTIIKVARRRDISAQEHATMPKYVSQATANDAKQNRAA